MRQVFKILPLVINLTALAAVVWIIVPAPDYRIWLLSVAASEWSLWFGALALLGIIGGLFSRKFNGQGKLSLAALLVGGLAFIISLYPFFSALSIARQRNVSLSLKTYFNEIWKTNNLSANAPKDFTTYTFAQDDGDLQLDVYLPTNATTANGASVIVVHGGSWSGGARNDFPQWNRLLAAQGYTVFDIDYRLAPQPNYLSATGDVKCAVRWVKNHAADFKVAPGRIAVLGRSAGAHLVLLAAYSADDARLPATPCTDDETSEVVRAVVSFYAPTDLPWGYDNPANRFVIDGPATLIRFLGGSPHDSGEISERFVLASPVAHVSSKTPPTLLIHGGHDQLVRSENMTRLAGRLKEANAPHKTLFIPYAQHGFDYNFNGFGAQIAQSEILDFLRENLQAD
jgi:acetyl esterase/lipase